MLESPSEVLNRWCNLASKVVKREETKTLSLSKGSIIDLVPEQGTLKRDGFKKSKKGC